MRPFAGRAAVSGIFVRRTQTRSRLSGEPYFTHRLVRTERVGGRVKQVTLLNLGRQFELPAEHWPLFCSRLSDLLSAQDGLAPVDLPATVEAIAQRYAAQIGPRAGDGVGSVARRGRARVAPGNVPVVPEAIQQSFDLLPTAPAAAAAPLLPAHADLVHADTLELLDARSVGVESLALHALAELGIVDSLRGAGFNRVSLAAAVGQIVARMAHPASERATHAWLQRHSGLGELWGHDFEGMSLTRLYRVADSLWRQHDQVEAALYARLSTVFGLSDTIALYDLTNTYFEGLAKANPLAQRGRSKEKRSDAPLVTLGLVLDGQGFVRRSQVFAGNVAEKSSLKAMLDGLNAPAGALVILDRGIVSEANLDWLREHGYRYLVMSCERADLAQPTLLRTVGDTPVYWQRIEDTEGGDVRVLCHSPERENKEAAMTALQRSRFEARINAIAEGLTLPRRSKKADHAHQRIGRSKPGGIKKRHFHSERDL